MQRISTQRLQQGMIVARTIYDVEGRKLLSSNTVLNEKYINRLKSLFIPGIYVLFGFEDPDIGCPEDVISEETRLKAIKHVYKAFQKFQFNGTLDVKNMEHSSQSIVDQLLNNKNNVVQMTDIRRYDSYTFSHSVNVCVLSTMLGILLNYSKKRLQEVAFGALLHDVGKIKISNEILNKHGKLTTNEFSQIQKHPEFGFQILQSLKNTSVVPMHVAYQHHEKFDGTGYPRHLKGNEIHEYARIVAIADVYDALTSDRPYKNAISPYEAYKIMVKSINSQFENRLLELFFENIAVFPTGTTLQLNTGEYAIVTQVLQKQTFTPKVKLLATAEHKAITDQSFIDLSSDPLRYVCRVLDEEEIFLLMHDCAQFIFK